MERAVEVRESFGAAAETHILAEVVSSVKAVSAFLAVYTGLNGNALANLDRSNTIADRSYNTGCFVAEYKRALEHKVAITAVDIVVHYGHEKLDLA